MIPAIIRRLEAVPILGTQMSRLRPFAHRLYRVRDQSRRAFWMLVTLRHGGGARLHGRALLRQLLTVGPLYYVWLATLPYRPLLSENPARLSPLRRVQRRLLLIFLALPDPLYRRAFAVFERRLARCARSRGDTRGDGVLMMIGTLGAGGAERQLVLTTTELIRRGYPVLGLAWLDPPNSPARFFLHELQAAGVAVTKIGKAPATAVVSGIAEAIAGLPPDLRPVADYAATFADEQPAVAHLWLDEINVRGGIAAVATGVPRIILGLRNVPPDNFVFHHPYMREGYRWLARQPAVTLVNNSQAGARAYEAWLGLPEGVIGCIHNGFRFDRQVLDEYRAGRGRYRARIGIPAEAPLIGGVFRMSEEKRPLLWLEIAALVRRAMPDAEFLLVGGGPLDAQMQARAARADLAGAVHFTGYERDVLGAMADMDLLLLASRLEGLPNVLVEAQALGVPVVTMKAGGAPETVKDGVTGIVLPDDGTGGAADVLVRLLRDRRWRAEAGRQAHAFVASAFAIEGTVDEFVRLYVGGCTGKMV